MDKSIRAISPFPRMDARPDKRAGWGFEQDEGGKRPFAARLRALTKDQDNVEQPNGAFNSFENPAFNIISGKTNYTLMELASSKETEQLDLFKQQVPIYKDRSRA